MGMHDELYCEAELPDADVPAGAVFATKAFPYPFLCRYTITRAGRLIDASGRDLDVDGYLEFYYYLERPVNTHRLVEYRAHFCRGQLENIFRVNEEPEGEWTDRVIYGLAAYRIFALAAPSNFISGTSEDDVERLQGPIGNLKPPAAATDNTVARPAEEQAWVDAPPVGRELL